MIRVLIADDHPVVREGLEALINGPADMEVVAEVSNGREALEKFLACRPDVALMDLRMPVLDGLDAILAIREQVPTAKIVVLTTFDGDEDVYRALQAGAKGYLLKDADLEELLECIRAVHQGQTWIPPVVAGKLAARLSGPNLTARELEVLKLMVSGKSNKEIGTVLEISEGTVKGHINHILEKFGVSGRAEAMATALKRGIVRLA